MKKLYTMLGVLFFASSLTVAQNQKITDERYQMLQEQMELIKQKYPNYKFENQEIYKSKGFFDLIDPVQEWRTATNTNPELNYGVFEMPIPAGDINGDGSQDYIVVDLNVRDVRTSDLSDFTDKTAIFYSPNFTIDPDEVVYEQLFPIGDVNGDGFDDLAVQTEAFGELEILNGSESGFESTGKIIFTGYGLSTVEGFMDVNGDGFGDFIIYENFSVNSNVEIVFGAGSFSDISNQNYLTQYEFNISTKFSAHDLDGDGDDELFQAIGQPGFGEIRTYDVNEFQELVELQRFEYDEIENNIRFTTFLAFDINGDGTTELFFESSTNWVFTEDSENPGMFLTTPIQFHDDDGIPVGDVNGDGRQDFILGDGENNDPFIAFGPEDLEDGLSLDVAITSNAGISEWFWNYNPVPYQGKFGDLNGDGIDDLVIEHFDGSIENGDYRLGRRFLFGNNSESYTNQFAMYNYDDFFGYGNISEHSNVGDINGDGFDDLSFTDFQKNKVEIRFGGPTISSIPDLIIEPDSISLVLSTIGGDFNGDGFSDVLVSSNIGTFMEIYLGSETFDTEVDIVIDPDTYTDTSYTSNGSYLPRNIGDINNDGIEDFVAHAVFARKGSDYLSKSFIFLGKSTLTATPDYEIDFANLLGTTQPLNLGWASGSAGDLNGDGFNDFYISQVNILDGVSGRVFIFYGSEDPSFDSVDQTLLGSSEGDLGAFGINVTSNGDFNGDGFSDIAVMSSFAADRAPITIYFGGEEFDGSFNNPLYITDELYRSGYSSNNFISGLGEVRFIPDLNGDGTDEILVNTAVGNLTNAMVQYGGFATPEDNLRQYLRAPNASLGLGDSQFLDHSAIGDFNNDGRTDIVMGQRSDNNDALISSRSYRFEFEEALKVTSVEDVPDDQGSRVRVNVEGRFFGYELVSEIGTLTWNVWRKDGDKWVNLATVPFRPNEANFVDVTLPTTKKTGDDTSADEYEIQATITDIYGSQMATSALESGFALDNLVPAEIQNVSGSVDDESISLEWSSSTEKDIKEYLVVEQDDGVLVLENPLLSTTNTEANFEFPSNKEKIRLVVLARDVNNNLSKKSNILQFSANDSDIQINIGTTQVITAEEGGEINDESTGSSISIPSGALNSDTEIEVGKYNKIPNGAFASGILVHFGPSGTTFNSPVEITINYDPLNLPDGISEGDLKLIRFNESENTWDELESTVDTERKTVTGFTSHFSGFGAGKVDNAISIDDEGERTVPTEFVLNQNYPNPFNPTTTISFGLPETADVKVEIYNALGQKVSTLVAGKFNAGWNKINFDASGFSSGLYIYRLITPTSSITKKMTLIK